MSATPCQRMSWLLTFFLFFLTSGRLEAQAQPKWPTDFRIVSLDGKGQLRSAPDFKAQPVLVQFWASWCRSCSGVSSELERLVLQSKASRLQFLSVSIDETTAEARKTVEQKKSSFLARHSFHDHKQHLRAALKIESVPTVVLIDRNGAILLRKEGHLSASEYLEIKAILSGLSS